MRPRHLLTIVIFLAASTFACAERKMPVPRLQAPEEHADQWKALCDAAWKRAGDELEAQDPGYKDRIGRNLKAYYDSHGPTDSDTLSRIGKKFDPNDQQDMNLLYAGTIFVGTASTVTLTKGN